ncbi:hypothetical protein [Pseudarthrobacter sp. ATCC 49987]|uniref:hypothetical protein n=1 Tax=Pseudarthrobacter sp. ATCC 49987 TaxID=2698204 RepID=UPI00136F7417|nr:hypothetical protein [Pseudarthrobacter sp. ATCC 49987]
MDARTSQGPATSELPRNLYFGAEDVVAQQPSITDANLALVRNQRHVLVGHVTHKAEKLLSGVRALKDFDATGNAGSTLDHLEALRDDLGKLTTNLIHDIEQAEERYELATRVSLDEVADVAAPKTPAAVEPTPQAPTAAGPKPSPGLAAANRRDEILFGVRA